jgi:hypothetical protein
MSVDSNGPLPTHLAFHSDAMHSDEEPMSPDNLMIIS